MKKAARSALVCAAAGLWVSACGGSADPTPDHATPLGQSAAALVCSPEGDHPMVLAGDAQNITGLNYTCTGVHAVQSFITVKMVPAPVAGKWLVTFEGISGHEWTIAETNGIIDWRVPAGTTPENVWMGCGGYTGSLRLRVDETSIMVSQYCHYMSGTSGCDRYSRVSGTVARGCAAPVGPDAAAADAASDPDASASSPDASAESAAYVDAATAADAGMDASTSAPRDPGLPSAAPSSGASEPAPAAPLPPSCAASRFSSRSSSTPGLLGLALSITLAFARRMVRRSRKPVTAAPGAPAHAASSTARTEEMRHRCTGRLIRLRA